ncbi:hypothetical protein LTR24_006104 [Lithohypha guttulata]|uniref:C2H2-type domain-containing protein n=1 Tax=Lithohypha guttulata TaxID=1690604 RepID=A0ABR0K7V2_9EURO|nr:hypothetical protein LTR24_006104 [Lithohypha guttulata]
MPSSLTQRRQAASNLPAFELPPPSHFAPPHYKFPPLSAIHAQSLPAAVSLGNLPTPPPHSANDTPNGGSHLPQHSMPVLPYTPTFWQGAGSTPGFNTGLTLQPWQNGQGFGGRPMYSPMSGNVARNGPHSPSSGSGSGLPPPPYEMNGVQSYSQAPPLASPSSSVNQGTQHPSMSNSMLTNQGRPHNQTSPISPADGVSRATSTPSLYAAMTSSAPPQPPYGFQNQAPVTQSPHSASAPPSTASPSFHHGPIPQISTHSSQFVKPPYPSYSLPAMPGPVLSNVNSPGSQMSLVGNMHAQMMPMHFNSGYAANPQLAYAQARANSPQQAANQDRPFKCDECPQSFNRNHDLKRHKRIHLAVKPFPCAHCDKSFSRKDALKRHILVKGCGKAGETDMHAADGVKSESGSDSQDNHNVAMAA